MFVSSVCVIVLFFFKQKTAYEMRISDWSSDVCSSDLDRSASAGNPGCVPQLARRRRRGMTKARPGTRPLAPAIAPKVGSHARDAVGGRWHPPPRQHASPAVPIPEGTPRGQTGRAEWRDMMGQVGYILEFDVAV